jgi:putative SOS response-associated peptidase YedK
VQYWFNAMCGRFTLRTPSKDIVAAFGLIDAPDLKPRFNIAPTQQIAAIKLDPETGTRELSQFRWGLIPSWADDPSIGYKMINARAESVAVKPAYRSAFKKGRCLIVADGFYEWKKTGKNKQPFFIRLKDD